MENDHRGIESPINCLCNERLLANLIIDSLHVPV
jgi:hypothetical protein